MHRPCRGDRTGDALLTGRQTDGKIRRYPPDVRGEAFAVGGGICGVAQVVINLTKLTSGKILVFFIAGGRRAGRGSACTSMPWILRRAGATVPICRIRLPARPRRHARRGKGGFSGALTGALSAAQRGRDSRHSVCLFSLHSSSNRGAKKINYTHLRSAIARKGIKNSKPHHYTGFRAQNLSAKSMTKSKEYGTPDIYSADPKTKGRRTPNTNSKGKASIRSMGFRVRGILPDPGSMGLCFCGMPQGLMGATSKLLDEKKKGRLLQEPP